MAEKILISSFRNIKDHKPQDMGLDDFLSGIRTGVWQDAVLAIRTIKDKKERQSAKEKCPNVRVSGSFSSYSDKDLRKHSGYIAIDIDDLNDKAESVKELVANDPYVAAAFVSISGTGDCLLFKIDPTKHLESFEGIAAYLYETYSLLVDQSGKNVSRARYVSFDPGIIENPGASTFKKYLPKKKAAPINKVVFVQSDFDDIITQLYSRGCNLCETYPEWVSVAYSLISQYGESGLAYFHTLSSLSSKYDSAATEKQYANCLKSHSHGGKSQVATIASIYHHAKHAGIDIYSARTKEVIRATVSQSKAGVKVPEIANYLQKFHDIPTTEGITLVQAVVDGNVQFSGENIIDDIQSYLHRYELRKNLISRNTELNNKPLDDSDLNSIYIDLRSVNDKITKDLVCSVIFSNRTPQYNPIKDLLSEKIHAPDEYPNLIRILSAIKTDTEGYEKWITKWLVGLIASAYGNYSPLTLVFCGEDQGTGKTHFFRYLLPKRLRSLYAESKMDAGKDDEILMTKKIIIMDDEYGGKSKKEYEKMKNITVKEWINVREPFGRVTVDLRRLAMFAGTSNTLQILNDPTGNRRVIPIHITAPIDKVLYNGCNKDELFHELHALFLSGYDYTVLHEEILELNENTDIFKTSSAEDELVARKLEPGNSQQGEWLTLTEIIQYLIADTRINTLSNTRLGMVLTSMKFEKKRMWSASKLNTCTCFHVIRIGPAGALPH